jgi:hypothetical protein
MENITQQCDRELALLLFNNECHYRALCSIAMRAISESDMLERSKAYYSEFFTFTDEQEEDVLEDLIELYAEYNPSSDMEEVTLSLINGQIRQAREQYNAIVIGNGGNEREVFIDLLHQVEKDFLPDETFNAIKKILGV